MTEDEVIDLAAALLKEHGLFQQGWRFVWEDGRGPMAGQCRTESLHVVGFRKVLLNTAPQNVQETILHEIAHTLTIDHARDVRQWHDQVWYDKLIEIGGTGTWITDDGGVYTVKVHPTYLTPVESSATL